MILSDREIKAAVHRRVIAISPEPLSNAWSSTSLDLGLSKDLTVWRNPSQSGARTVISPHRSDFNFGNIKRMFGEEITISNEGYVFQPQSFLLAWTVEKIKLPFRSRLAARVEGKSSLARLGIGVHVTAPTIHAGFGDKPGDDQYPGSQLQLEMWNVGPLEILLLENMPICQLIFEWVDGTPERGYEGRFAIQGPTPH